MVLRIMRVMRVYEGIEGKYLTSSCIYYWFRTLNGWRTLNTTYSLEQSTRFSLTDGTFFQYQLDSPFCCTSCVVRNSFLFTIKEYYVGGTMRCPSGVSVRELREACDYFLVPFSAATVKCNNLSTHYEQLLKMRNTKSGKFIKFSKMSKT